jgi:hypothetical protein
MRVLRICVYAPHLHILLERRVQPPVRVSISSPSHLWLHVPVLEYFVDRFPLFLSTYLIFCPPFCATIPSPQSSSSAPLPSLKTLTDVILGRRHHSRILIAAILHAQPTPTRTSQTASSRAEAETSESALASLSQSDIRTDGRTCLCCMFCCSIA